jgi:SAM-dependent methyltransferase
VCRACGATLSVTFVDLGFSPLSNSYVLPEKAGDVEPCYPLHAFVCTSCFLVQVEAFQTSAQIFSDYAYFSSYSDSWLSHSRAYTEEAAKRLQLGKHSLVVEVASNDGYLLQYFDERHIPVLGIEPAKNVAAVAIDRGIRTECEFLGAETGAALRAKHGRADLLVANNVIAHVPDVHDFFAGLQALLADRGTLTVEFPHLLRLIEGVEFDTIYHEHFSYYSLYALEGILARHSLRAFDVEELPTHGGSLRVWISHIGDTRDETRALRDMRERERTFGMTEVSVYMAFAQTVQRRKREVLRFLIDAKEQGKHVAGYGAPAKGNTLINYCGIRTDLLDYTVDRNPVKQGTFLPGSRIPVYAPEHLRETKPDFVFILPWNIRDEILQQIAWIREWGGCFVVAMPSFTLL